VLDNLKMVLPTLKDVASAKAATDDLADAARRSLSSTASPDSFRPTERRRLPLSLLPVCRPFCR
jgi:hypothetical protein